MTASLFSIETGSGEVDTCFNIWELLNRLCPEILVWALFIVKTVGKFTKFAITLTKCKTTTWQMKQHV